MTRPTHSAVSNRGSSSNRINLVPQGPISRAPIGLSRAPPPPPPPLVFRAGLAFLPIIRGDRASGWPLSASGAEAVRHLRYRYDRGFPLVHGLAVDVANAQVALEKS
jgi:hypothetical protein